MSREPHRGRRLSAAVSREYDRLAHRYELRWRSYVQASVRETLARLPLRPGIRVLDLGCGTGALLQRIVENAADVSCWGLDVSHRMLTLAAQRAPTTRFVHADAHRLPFAPGSFDLVVSTSALHYWPEPERVLAEIQLVLDRCGRLVITDWCDDFLACRVCDRVLRLLNRAHARIYGSQKLQALLEQSRYQLLALDQYKINWFWGLMTADAKSMSSRSDPQAET